MCICPEEFNCHDQAETWPPVMACYGLDALDALPALLKPLPQIASNSHFHTLTKTILHDGGIGYCHTCSAQNWKDLFIL